MHFEDLGTEMIYHGRAFDVCQKIVRLPDGRQKSLDVVLHNPSVTILPLDSDGQIWFIRQYRHPVGKQLLELPAGVMEQGESPEATAAREIREEIGMAAGNLKKIAEFYLAPGYSTEYMYVFLATELTRSPLQADEDEYITVEKITAHRAYHLAVTGQIKDAKSIAALMMARPQLLY